MAVACVGGANAFVGGGMRPVSVRSSSTASVRMTATVPDLLKQTEELKLLSKASELGLLSKLEKAGLTLKDVEKLLPLVDENDLIGLAQASGPSLLAIAPAALAAAPNALPLLGAALAIPAEALFIAALGSVGAGLALVSVIPDDSVPDIAIQTFIAFPLIFVLPAVLGVGGFALNGLKNGSLVNLLTSSKPAAAPVSAPAAPMMSSAPVAAAAPISKPSGGRPAAGGGRPAAAKKAAPAPKAAPKPKPVPKAKPMPVVPKGNLSNIPKAL